MTLRSRVYLSIHGMEKHEEVTDLIGLVPTCAWNSGDAHEIDGEVKTHRRFTKWGYGGEAFIEEDENFLYEKLFSSLAPHWDALKNLPSRYRKTIVLVHETDRWNVDMIITASHIAKAAEINASWRLDIYSLYKRI